MTARFLWLSDTHLNRVPERLRLNSFTRFIEAVDVRNVVVTGDVSTGRVLRNDITWLSRAHPGHRFHVVLGNHDYHGSTFRDAHRAMGTMATEFTNVNWLSAGGVTSLSESVALVGHEGWFCATAGVRPWWTRFCVDAFRIGELRIARRRGVDFFLNACRTMAERSVEAICNSVGQALRWHDTVVVATHFPPWPEATDNEAWGYVGRRWVNYDTNWLLGQTLEQIALENAEKKIVVLSGHTHVPKTLNVRHNLVCHVSSATIGERIISNVIAL